MYSWPWMEGAREEERSSNGLCRELRLNLLIRATSLAEKRGTASLLSWMMWQAMRTVRKVPGV